MLRYGDGYGFRLSKFFNVILPPAVNSTRIIFNNHLIKPILSDKGRHGIFRLRQTLSLINVVEGKSPLKKIILRTWFSQFQVINSGICNVKIVAQKTS